MTDYGSIAFDFIERVDRARTPAAISDELFRIIPDFGFHCFCISGMPELGESMRDYLLLSGWPTGWLERYVDRGYVHVDPVIRKLKATTYPFRWDDAPYDREREPDAHRVMTEATEFRMHGGLTVPIFSVSGFQAGVTFGAEHEADLSERARAALHLIAIYAHNAVRDSLSGTGNRACQRAKQLSPRQTEILRWIAAGKTNWEIGRILGISERTVEHQASTAAHRLNAVTRAQAVAEALRARIIH